MTHCISPEGTSALWCPRAPVLQPKTAPCSARTPRHTQPVAAVNVGAFRICKLAVRQVEFKVQGSPVGHRMPCTRCRICMAPTVLKSSWPECLTSWQQPGQAAVSAAALAVAVTAAHIAADVQPAAGPVPTHRRQLQVVHQTLPAAAEACVQQQQQPCLQLFLAQQHKHQQLWRQHAAPQAAALIAWPYAAASAALNAARCPGLQAAYCRHRHAAPLDVPPAC